jgi:hypothetical protein
MLQLVLSFDTEDYVTPEAADGEKFWAEELSARGMRGSFQCVAEVIRFLRRRRREDVIEALGRHEIGCHTDRHSAPPVPPLTLDGVGLAEGIEWVLRREAPGWGLVMETFGRVPISYCPPGDSWTPHVLLALAQAGVKVWCASVPSPTLGPNWYCGLLCLNYDLAFDSFMGEEAAEEQRFKQAFEDALARKAQDGVMVVYTHPSRLVTTRFWDAPFYGGAHPHPLPPAPLRPAAHIQVLKERFRRLLDWIRERRDVELADYSTVYSQRSKHRRDLQCLLDEHNLRPGEAGKLPLRETSADCPYTKVLEDFRYSWPIYPEGFTGDNLRAMARELAWSYAEAKRD